MFETLTRGFTSAKNLLQGKTVLNEANIEEAIREIRLSLLEADVEFNVTKAFLAKVKERALGQIVSLKVSHKGSKMRVSPGDHFIKICQEEIEALMGPVDTSIKYPPHGPAKIMMIGLQGSGKTTTAAKLAQFILSQQKKQPLLVAADIYRPAAVEQLKILGERLNIAVYHEDNASPVTICQNAIRYAIENKQEVVIFDTAGRLAVDDVLMIELEDIKRNTAPENIFLVCDAMIGQDAVNTAKEFNERLTIDGIVLTKLDGDARGGAALSVKQVTGKPIKFLGIGEGLDKLEEFRPEGLASRILGFGDIVGLVKDFEAVVDEKKAEEDAMRMLKGDFSLDDFLEQVKVIQKMGSLQDIFEKMPFFGGALPQNINLDDKELIKVESLIHSMTRSERQNPDILNESRMNRIAKGSGRNLKDLKELIERFKTMQGLMRQLGKSSGLMGKIPGLKQLNQMRQLKQMDLGSIFGGMGGPQSPEDSRKSKPLDRKKLKAKRKAERQARKRNR